MEGVFKVESGRVIAQYTYDEHDCLTLTSMPWNETSVSLMFYSITDTETSYMIADAANRHIQ